MKLSESLIKTKEWTLLGPMGPDLPEKFLTHPVLCVDGGSRFCSESTVWIGDGDSAQENIKTQHHFKFSPLKSSSDFALALDLFQPTQPHVFHAWGFLGGRKDHEFINLGEASRFLKTRFYSEIIFYDYLGRPQIKCLSQGDWKLQHHGSFSLTSLERVSVKLDGECLYKILKPTTLEPMSSLGLSNVAQGEFHLACQGPVILFFPEPS